MFKRTQINVMVKFFDEMYFADGDRRPHINVGVEDLFPMSENHVFRNMKYIATNLDQAPDGTAKLAYYGKFLILRNDRRQVDIATDTRPLDFLDFGCVVHFDRVLSHIFGVSEITYKRALRSASQFRTAKLLATEESLVADVRSHASYGWIERIEGRMFKTVAKVEPYIGLALSSSKYAGRGYTDINIADYKAMVDITGALTMDKDKATGKNIIVRFDELSKSNIAKMELTDGEALISPRAMAKAAYESGIIYKSEYKTIMGAFKLGVPFAEQLTDEFTCSIWAKIPAGIQFRYGLKKGFAIVSDHDYLNMQGKQFDFVFPDGANKGEVKRYEHRFENGQVKMIDHGEGATNDDVELCIANVSTTKEKYWGLLNYQFIMSLALDFTNDIQPLATKAIQFIMKALESPENAMAFIGMVENGDEEQYTERNAVQKIREILEASPRVFHMKWVQAKIKQLMTKSIEDMAKGRIPLEDSRFVFIVTDPNTLLKNGKPLLQKGECYYNGLVGERAIFRSPLIHKSEAVVVNLVSRPELAEAFGHLKNVLVMNAFDDSLPRMGGADTDGDKVYMTSEPLIIKAVERGLPMIYGDAETQELEPFKWTNGGVEQIKQYDKNTLLPSQIGVITNYCTAIADKARDIRSKDEESAGYWDLVTLGRVLQGKIIDDAKRGTTTRIDDRLRVTFYPKWLETGKNRYESYSPMGRLYRWIKEIVMPAFKTQFQGLKDYRENILIDFKDYNPAELNRILPLVGQLEESYRQDVAYFFENMGDEPNREDFESNEEYKEELEKRNALFEKLMERHQMLLSSLDASDTMIGMACIHVAENLQRSGSDKIHSYPFVIGDKYVMALLSGLDSNFKLVRAYDVDGGLWTTSVAVNENVLYNADGVEVGRVKNLANGAYDTHEYKGSFFVKAAYAKAKKEITRTEKQFIQFEMKGFKKLTGVDESGIIKMINQQTVRLQKIVNEKGNWLGVMFAGQQIGAVGKETFTEANFAQGKELKVIGLQPIKGILKVTAEIGTGVVEVEHVEPQQSNIAVYDQVEFDLGIGM